MARPRSGAAITKQKDPRSEADHAEIARIRMTVDLIGPLAEELEKAAIQSGKTKADIIREGLDYVFKAIQARDAGFNVGAWKEEPDGKIIRSREFLLSR